MEPVFKGGNVHFEVAARIRGLACGGIALVHEFARSLGLAQIIDDNLHLFKRHFPYFESDHVLNMAYNIMAGGTCVEDLERLRNDEAYLDVLGADRIPDPTTAGDFLRRFDIDDVLDLMYSLDLVRPLVWKHLPRSERRLARIDVDGTISETTGECKQGMDMSYKGTWGYAPLIVSLTNTGEVLCIVNRPGSAPSHLGADWFMDQAADRVLDGGFDEVLFRGDTAFALTRNFDRWTEEGKKFVFGIEAHPTFVERAEDLPETAWKRLRRRKKGKARATRRERPTNVKERIVVAREYTNQHLEEEHITEVEYTPVKCKKTYRMIVLRKTIRVTKGQLHLRDETRYFFYVTNMPKSRLSTKEVVFEANDRCNQENLIAQLNEVHALRMPSNGLVSNWAWMVITSLAWNLKTWMSICLPKTMKAEGREIRRMEFRRFLNSLMLLPCQVVKTGRRVVLRLLTWSPWAHVLLDATEHFRRQRCLA